MLFASGLGASLVGLLTPSAAMAISITDPVFGDIEVWQFLILTAGYWIAIEAYLDNKYDEDKKTVMPTLKKKDEDDDGWLALRGAWTVSYTHLTLPTTD